MVGVGFLELGYGEVQAWRMGNKTAESIREVTRPWQKIRSQSRTQRERGFACKWCHADGMICVGEASHGLVTGPCGKGDVACTRGKETLACLVVLVLVCKHENHAWKSMLAEGKPPLGLFWLDYWAWFELNMGQSLWPAVGSLAAWTGNL